MERRNFVLTVFLFLSLDCGLIVETETDHRKYYSMAKGFTCGNGNILNLERSSRILGGQVASLGEFPFLASIQNADGLHFCTGFIINFKTLISAGHCFISSMYGSQEYKSYRISVGSNNWTETNDTNSFRISKVVVHPHYSYLKPNVENDIAILTLDREIRWTPLIQPICLATSKLEPNEYGLVAGWGVREQRQNLNEWMKDTSLHKVSLPIWTNQACQMEYRKHRVNWNTKPTHICAGFQEMKRDTCFGDSGSPLILLGQDGRKIAYGIVSVGEGCSTQLPGIYTRISSFISWIETNS